MQALFVRHGLAESNTNLSDRRVGEYAALVDTGIEQIEATAEILGKFVTTKTIYSSPIPRAIESARIIARQLKLDVILDPRLREIDKGEWEGMPVSKVVKIEEEIDIKERYTFRPPGGENWQDVGTRVAAFVEELRQDGQSQIVMVSHDHPIRMGIGALMGKPIEEWEDMPIANASITALYYEDGFWQLDDELRGEPPAVSRP